MKQVTSNKVLRSVIISAIIIVMLGSTCLATTYSTSLSLDFRSSLTGADRSYVGSTHKIAIALTSKGVQSSTNDNYCDITLSKKNTITYTSQGTKTLNLMTVGNTYSTTYSASSGTFRYFFTNRYISSDTKYTKVTDFTSNTVALSSY